MSSQIKARRRNPSTADIVVIASLMAVMTTIALLLPL